MLLPFKTAQSPLRSHASFTLIELMIVLGIMVVLSTVAILSLSGTRGMKDLQNTADEIGTLLREAQSRSVNEEDGAAWGVHFDNTDPSHPFFALFSGTYSASTREGIDPLPSDIVFGPSTLASGATLNVTFAEITGLPSTSTAITLDLAAGGALATSSTIDINASGLISY